MHLKNTKVFVLFAVVELFVEVTKTSYTRASELCRKYGASGRENRGSTVEWPRLLSGSGFEFWSFCLPLANLGKLFCCPPISWPHESVLTLLP